MPQPRSLLDLLRTKTGSDDLLRTLLKAQAAHSQSAVQSITDDTAIRVIALNKSEPAVPRRRWTDRHHDRRKGGQASRRP